MVVAVPGGPHTPLASPGIRPYRRTVPAAPYDGARRRRSMPAGDRSPPGPFAERPEGYATMRTHSSGTGTLMTLFAAAAVIGTAACQPQTAQQTEEAAVDTAAIHAELDSIRSAFEEHFAAGDADAMAALYAEDAIYSHPGLPAVQGRDSIRAVISRTHPPGGTIEIQPTDVMVLGPDVVYEFGTGTVSFTPPDAEEAVTMESTYSALLRRTADGWRLAREALSANSPPPSAGAGQ